MSKQSYLCHLKNKYHGKGSVLSSNSSITVISNYGELLCALEKSCHGAYECKKEELGARDEFSLDSEGIEVRYVQCKKSNKILKNKKVAVKVIDSLEE